MVQIAVGKLENVVADAVEEGAVVGDHQQGDVGGGEVVLQPFGHLDIEMTEWLENYLSSANITLLMVTHDRSFLDRVCNDIFELSNGNLYHYRGKYDYFLEKKAERLANAAAEQEKLRQLYRRELAWVHTSPQARTSKARARINNFEKLQEAVSVRSEAAPEAFKVQAERDRTSVV